MHYGKYTFDWMNPDSSTYWMEAGAHGGSMEYTRTGLLYAGQSETSNFKIFTVGLGLEDHANPWDPTIYTYPGNPANPKYLAPDTNLYAHYNATQAPYGPFISTPNVYYESGTLEYNLWRVANTTGGMYFHAPDADDLEGIFTQIGMMLATGFNQTRSSAPAPDTRAVLKNSDKRAVTEPFSLVNVTTAKLSFWHKYNILQGGNGAFLQVGYKTSALGDWQFRYIVPPGQYTGMLYHQYNVYDSFGNPVKWCWNGLSHSGSYGWDFANVDISPYVPQGAAMDGHIYRSEVVVVFNYTQFGGGTGGGWYLDNVKLDVTRAEEAAIYSQTRDLWKMTESGARSGTHSWSNVNELGEITPS